MTPEQIRQQRSKPWCNWPAKYEPEDKVVSAGIIMPDGARVIVIQRQREDERVIEQVIIPEHYLHDAGHLQFAWPELDASERDQIRMRAKLLLQPAEQLLDQEQNDLAGAFVVDTKEYPMLRRNMIVLEFSLGLYAKGATQMNAPREGKVAMPTITPPQR